MNDQASPRELLGGLLAEVRALRAEVSLFSGTRVEAPGVTPKPESVEQRLAGLPGPGTALPLPPETSAIVWVVLSRDPDEPRKVQLVAVVASEADARAVCQRVQAHEKEAGAYASTLVVRTAQFGAVHLYGIDGLPDVRNF